MSILDLNPSCRMMSLAQRYPKESFLQAAHSAASKCGNCCPSLSRFPKGLLVNSSKSGLFQELSPELKQRKGFSHSFEKHGFRNPHEGRRRFSCQSALSLAPLDNNVRPKVDNNVRPKAKLVASVRAPSWTPSVPEHGLYRDLTFALIGAGFALLLAIFVGQWWTNQNLAMFTYRASDKVNTIPEPGPTGQKESVEWVNMVVGKMWKIYRRSVEKWIVDILQPAIDKLAKPDYIDRIEVAELNLDYEPLAFRNVQRLTSRRANDLQYHIGLRYTGDARCLLNLHLKASAFGTNIPVGVYDLDVDAELWVKIRLAPIAPYIGTVSLAFVRLPTIKLVLAPFRLVNLFSIPFLSSFLTKLLTVDLPNLYVLPRRINFDIIPQEHSFASHIVEAVRIGPGTTASPPKIATTEGFKGELTVTLCEAQNLPIGGLIGWSNPYCTLAIGEQWVESKKNSETSHQSGHKNPVWNQDFQFLVSDPKRQHMKVYVRDSHLTFSPNIGYCEVPIWKLKDCVPTDAWVPLKREGPFGTRRVSGAVRLLLTYKSFVDDDLELGSESDDTSQQTIKIYSEGESEEAAVGAATAAAKDAETQVRETGTNPGFAEHVTSDEETGLEIGRAVAEVTRLQAGQGSASSLPASKNRKLPERDSESNHDDRYAAGDTSGAGEGTDTPSSSGQDEENGWAFLVNEIMSKVREMAKNETGAAGAGGKKVVVKAMGKKATGEDSDGAIWTEVSERDVGGVEGRDNIGGAGPSSSDNNGRPKVLGSGIGTVKEDGTTDVIPTGDDVRKRFDEFFDGEGELLDEKGRPSRWSEEVREFVEKGGYDSGAEAIQAKKQEALWRGTRDFIELWGRENGNGKGSGNEKGNGNGTANENGASASGRGQIGVLENGKFVRFFDTGNGHHTEHQEAASEGKGEDGNGTQKLKAGFSLQGKVEEYRDRFPYWLAEKDGFEPELPTSSRTAVLERSATGLDESKALESIDRRSLGEKATGSIGSDSEEASTKAGQINSVVVLLVAIAVALLLAWGHIQALKTTTVAVLLGQILS